MEVTASIRVQEETYEIVGSVDNPSQLTQDIEKDKQSDTLDLHVIQRQEQQSFM